jgi:glutamate synthase (NADPH/NADH) large chain
MNVEESNQSGEDNQRTAVTGTRGLYRKEDEHDSCGIGFVADIKGKPSHNVLCRGLEVLERMEHRGAESADNRTGDGAGVLLQIPHKYYKKLIPGLGESYGTGLMFLPRDMRHQTEISEALEETAAALGFAIAARRPVPVDSGVLGIMAAAVEPSIEQLVLAPLSIESGDLEISLYIFRKMMQKRAAHTGWYMPSLSSKTIVYKGMLMPNQFRKYYPELDDEDVETAVALVHSRFSTNTFPDWPLAQPFRLVSHNGEINTIMGNRFWMAAREAAFASCERLPQKLRGALADIVPVIEPGRSDSASFDNALELLVMAGRSLPHALMMLIPESWNNKNPISDELKAFYEYHACVMEPWDGPASMVFCDGRYVGGTLDRNGLRPSRYTVTRGGLVVMASETGVQDFNPGDIEYKGRLMPGKLLLVDLEEGRIIPDGEVKEKVYKARPYAAWVQNNVITLMQENLAAVDSAEGAPVDPEGSAAKAAMGTKAGAGFSGGLIKDERDLLFAERCAGYTREDRDRLLLVMAATAQEPTSSMGTDTPLAVFSQKPQRPYAYFKQVFAQVTNPPIDSIREDLVMTLTSFVGPQKNLLDETEEHCRRIKVLNPILTDDDLKQLLETKPGVFKSKVLDSSFFISHSSLESALDNLVAQSIEAVKSGVSLLVLSDKAALDPQAGLCPIPALLAAGAVHHGLIAAGLRMGASIIVESAEPREIMHFALLFGYGTDLVVPYGALASLEAICAGADGKRTGDFPHARKNYLKGMTKAVLKVMSKMGTSTLRSYRGAQIFEAVGLSKAVMDKCFKGTQSRIGGAGFAELEAEALALYKEAREKWEKSAPHDGPVPETLLAEAGQYRWRKNGERHAWNPETIHLLQWATRTGDYSRFKQFSAAANTLNQSPHVIRGLLDFAAAGRPPVPLVEVESPESIMLRFTTGAMSFGSISKEAHETIAAAMNSIHCRSNSGEGGESNDRYPVQSDGRWLRSAIKQVASARFGVTSEYLANAQEIQIKIAQGAKPGEGGQLPGHKVDVMIAKTRHSTPGVTLISPPPHHDIYSIEDLAELIFDLKNANPKARISVKLVSETGVGTVAAGVAKAHADNILISGYDGGTGASPQSSIRHAGLPWELGLSETHQILVRNGLRGRVRLQTDGQLKTGRDIVIAAMLGAEEFGFGTSTLITLGCVMMRKCHENTCPMGVATQDPELRRRFAGKSEHLVNFFRFLAMEVREIMAELGFKKFEDLVGRADLLVQKNPQDGKNPKSAGIDLSAILHREEGPEGIPGGKALHCETDQIHKIKDVLDRTLIEKCRDALEKKIPAAFSLPVKNTDRAVGAMLSYEVSTRFGAYGLPENFITADFSGSAGQSFGAFLAKGITFRLSGDANDYLGKGLSGGRITVAPPAGSHFKSEENIIVGNTVLYGATSGELYVAGVAGERFCVRNSGATAVVEGVGDHCAEYMTGGRLVVLGGVGRNFAAGMSGGIAYVLDKAGNFDFFLNPGMVELSGLDNEEDERFVKETVSRHVYWTGSVYARNILDNWAEYKTKFVKVLPVEYKWALQKMKLAELDRKLFEIREREELESRV